MFVNLANIHADVILALSACVIICKLIMSNLPRKAENRLLTGQRVATFVLRSYLPAMQMVCEFGFL